MERARRWLVVLATLALIALTATLQYRPGIWQQPDAEVVVAGFSLPGGLGPILLVGHVLKVMLLPLAVERQRYVGDADGPLAACTPCCSRLLPETTGGVTRIEAVAEFVAGLTLDPAGRETGSGLYAAYCRRRELRGGQAFRRTRSA